LKRELPLFITAVIGIFTILSFFVPHQAVSVPADFLRQCAVIMVAFGYVLGGANVLKSHWRDLQARRAGRTNACSSSRCSSRSSSGR
jgi:hypothetical protein